MQLSDKRLAIKSNSHNRPSDQLGHTARRSLWKLLSALYEPATRAWLSPNFNSHVKGEGLHLDCGTGEDTFLLATLAGGDVRFSGLDEDPVLIEQALQEKSRRNLDHVQFYLSSLAEWEQGQTYDIIFIRQTTPVLPDWQVLTQHLKAGGDLFIQVVDITGFHSFPYNHAFARSIEILRAISEMPAGTAAEREYLRVSLAKAGLETIELTSSIPAFMPQEYNSILSLILEWNREKILFGHHATREELNFLLLELKQYEAQEDTLISSPGICHIRARKPEK